MMLIMSVVLTVGLSIATQAITNIRTSAEEKNSEQAFSAAEAGLEQSLQNTNPISGSLPNNATYQTNIVNVSGTEFLLNGGSVVSKDDAADVWLSTYPGYKNPLTGNVTVYWGASTDTCATQESANTMSAIEIIRITGTTDTPQEDRAVFDPCLSRVAVNHFSSPDMSGGTVAGKSFAYKASFFVNSGLLLRIIPLYAPTTIGISGCDGANNNCTSLPSQGVQIQSVGTADTAQRKIVRIQSNPKIPLEVFSYSLFSPK
jgi:Tfp pilus assembly protein PilX